MQTNENTQQCKIKQGQKKSKHLHLAKVSNYQMYQFFDYFFYEGIHRTVSPPRISVVSFFLIC